MSRTDTLRFRHSQAIVAAASIAFIGALPVADARWYLAPVLLVPLAVLVWAWRAGTDVDPREVRVRALLGQRRLPWARIVELGVDPKGRAVARLDDGARLPLPAVRGTDLPRLVAVTGQPLASGGTGPEQPATSAEARPDQPLASGEARPDQPLASGETPAGQ